MGKNSSDGLIQSRTIATVWKVDQPTIRMQMGGYLQPVARQGFI
jgi:hypothetical protein